MLLRQENGRRSEVRDGFTLIELLAVMVILGLLASFGVSRLWKAKEHGLWTAVKSDLRNVATQQERYFNDHFQYATDPAHLPELDLTNGVVVTVTWTANNGWAGTATHSTFTTGQCGFFVGPAPSGVAPPATAPGEVACDQ
ncbi:MAG TPA: type II secretion system protein [Longimicrobiales bacterium]